MKTKLVDRRHLDIYDSEEDYIKSVPHHQTHLEQWIDRDPLYMERETFPYFRILFKFLKHQEYLSSVEYNFTRWMGAKASEYEKTPQSDKEDDDFYTTTLFAELAQKWTIALRFLCWVGVAIVALQILLLIFAVHFFFA